MTRTILIVLIGLSLGGCDPLVAAAVQGAITLVDIAVETAPQGDPPPRSQ